MKNKPSDLIMSLVSARVAKLIQLNPGANVDELIEQVTSLKESFKILDWASVTDVLHSKIEANLSRSGYKNRIKE
nr:hypothetical protein [Candidatus Sigynarchaeota archaeon]